MIHFFSSMQEEVLILYGMNGNGKYQNQKAFRQQCRALSNLISNS